MHFCSDSSIGGAVVTLKRLVFASDKQSFEHIVVLPKGALYINEFKKINVQVVEYKNSPDTSFSLQLTLECIGIIQKYRPHIVHTHGFVSARIAGRMCGVRSLIYTRHTFNEKEYSAAFSVMNRYITTRVVAVSSALISQIVQSGIEKNNIVLIENGTDKTDIDPNICVFDDGICNLLYLGRVVWEKGLVCALDAIKILNSKEKKVHLYIAGEGGHLPFLKDHAAKIGVYGDVTFLPYQTRDESIELFSRCHVAINCSFKNEASSNFIIESLSAGLPIAASSVGGNKYMIDDSIDGKLYPSGNCRALALAVSEIICSSDEYLRYRGNAVKKYNKRFTLEKMKNKYEMLWRDEYKKYYK